MTIGDSLGNLNYRYSTYSAGSRGKVLEVEINARRLYYNILAPTELCGLRTAPFTLFADEINVFLASSSSESSSSGNP